MQLRSVPPPRRESCDGATTSLKILTVGMLYPNPMQIRKGTFVRERLTKWVKRAGIEPVVLAPVPWFPFKHKCFGRYAEFARIPESERDGDIVVHHPRFISVPVVGRITTPWTYFLSVRSLCRSLRDHRASAIDAHFAFPDGVAAVLLGRALGLPVVVTVRGSDLNLMTQDPVRRAWIRWALRRCDAVIAVSAPLAARARELSGDAVPVTVLTNGVDRDRFRILREPTIADTFEGRKGPRILSVGNLVELKGHHLIVEAVARIPEASLIVVGRGEYRAVLERLVQKHQLADRVHIVGEVTQEELVGYYNFADALVLASSHEGMPNVVLESLSCGTPVIATAVGGIPDVLTSKRQGRLVHDRSSPAIATAIAEVLADPDITPDGVRESVAGFSWDATVDGVHSVFEAVTRGDVPHEEQITGNRQSAETATGALESD